MAHDKEKVNIGAEDMQEQYTLEAILSEYKSEAYINNERRLSKESLQQQAQEIIDEMKRSVDIELSVDGDKEEDSAEQLQTAAEDTSVQAEPEPAGDEEQAVQLQQAAPESVEDDGEKEPAGQEAAPEPPEVSVQQIDSDAPGVEISSGEDEKTKESGQKRAEKAAERAERRKKRREREKTASNTKTAVTAEAQDKRREEIRREPSLTEAMRRSGANITSLRRRTALAMLLALLSAAAAFTFKGGAVRFFGDKGLCLAVLIAQLVVMIMGADVLVRGVADLIRGKPRSAALTAAACVASVIDAVMIYIGAVENTGLPFCSAASAALAFEMYHERVGKSAYRTVFKAAKAAKLPTVVTAEQEKDKESTLLNKQLGTAAGFVTRTLEPGYYERAVSKLCPLLLVASLVLAATAASISGGNFFHCLAAATAVSAGFSLSGVFSVPFYRISKNLANHGVAIAGWGGAYELDAAEGIIIRDNDVFPENTVTLNGIKVFSGASAEKIISYTGSLIIASGSGLSRLFGELLREYSAAIYRVEEFLCYEGGGVGANIGGDRVLVGSAAFMKLMGIALPTNIDVAGAVYSAVNGVAAGVFVVNYEPVVIVQSSLVELMQSDIRPVFALRDFNITPAMIAGKYKISAEKMEFPSLEDRYALSSEHEGEEKGCPAALMSREGLGHFTALYKGGERLIKAVKRGFAMSAAGAAFGLLTVTYAAANGAFASASVTNVLIYSVLWALAIRLTADRSDEK